MEKQSVIEQLLGFRQTILAICIGFTKTAEDAEELTQDVYLKAMKHISNLKDHSVLKGWFYQITRRCCIDHLRREKIKTAFYMKDHEETVDTQTPEATLIALENRLRVKKNISRLPKKFKEVIILREYGNLSYDDIALTLKTSKGTVTSRLSRARDKLETLLNNEVIK